MSLAIYLDDCAFSHRLRQLLLEAGHLAVYQDNDVTKDMSYADIVRAIANLEKTGITLEGRFWSLNAYRW